MGRTSFARRRSTSSAPLERSSATAGRLKDLERCIEITQPGSYERLRGYINLGSTLSELGELPA